MKDLIARLQALGPVITRICAISGTPGVSIGILHHGELFYTASYGYRDVEAKLPPNEDTVFHVASLCKSMTAMGVASLVNDGKVNWNSTIASTLPDFNHADPVIQKETTLTDILSHRTGLASQVQFWMQEFGRMSLPRGETVDIFSSLPKVLEFRKDFLYQNWGYGVAAVIIERLSGLSWGKFLESKIFEPLGMTRTTSIRNYFPENVAKGYIALEDGTFFENEVPHAADNTVLAGAAGIQTTVRDLLSLYKAILETSHDQFKRNSSSTPGSPLKELPALLSPHIVVPGTSAGEQAYGMGWTLTELPGTMGITGINSMSVPTSQMPIVGRGLKPTRVYHHNGSLAAFLACAHLLPDTQSAVVVLTNSIAKNDCADWLAQLILETFLDSPEKNDYVKFAQESADASIAQWHAMSKELADKREANTKPREFSVYVGQYYNSAKNWFMDVFLQDGELHICMQGDRRETYKLDHYHHDTFSWLLTWDESARRGRFRNPTADYYLLKFQVQDSETVGMKWTIDGAIPEGQIFTKSLVPKKEDTQKPLNFQ